MPTRYLNPEADNALSEVARSIKKSSGVEINQSMAVIFLYAAWKEAKK